VSITLVDTNNQNQIKNLEKYIKEKQTGMDNFISLIDLSYENDSNQINECLIDEEQDKIKNASFYKGTKDTGLIEVEIVDQKQRNFLKKSIDFAFSIPNANTVTIFSDKENKTLESLGFESLGKYQGKTTYIKEQTKEEKIGRIK
jgi:hypothetical protein